MAADRPDPMQSTSGNTNASTPSTSGAIAREHRLLFRGKSRRRERDDSRSNDNGEVVFCWVLRCLSVLHVSLLPHFYARELAHISHGNSVCLFVSLSDVGVTTRYRFMTRWDSDFWIFTL